MRIDPPVTPGPEPPRPALATLPVAPTELIDAGNENRLVSELRARAAARDRNTGLPDPTAWLAHSAVEFLKAARAPAGLSRERATNLATAIADLTVTGRKTYDQFRKGIGPLALEQKVRDRLDAQRLMPRATDAEIRAAMDQALDRAYAVAWALRGSASQRAALRPGLGWVAVSAEDDMPHRPVNLPAPPFEQYEVTVRTPVPGGALPLATRFIVACADPPRLGADPVPGLPVRQAPPDPIPFIPGDHHVLLFLHGHGSGAEEALEIIPDLLEQGRLRGRKYAVISFDLPNNGYSETFDHRLVAAASATTFPTGPFDKTPIATPILDFIENFVVDFVDEVENTAMRYGTPRIKHRIAGVFGGSLGGNLGLRLGRRQPMPDWMPSIVAWSPASAWKAKVGSNIGWLGSDSSRDRFVLEQTELPTSRADYFNRVYDKSEGPVKPQPQYWYGKSFAEAPSYIAMSRASRREIYNPDYRLWHWRVACEQLIYSHAENVVYGDSTTPIRYTLNTVRTLLATGAEDNADFVRIYSATEKLGKEMTRTPGRLLLVNNTGHSIHAERPLFFATQIAAFLGEDQLPPPAGGTRPFLSLLLDEAPTPEQERTNPMAGLDLLLLAGVP